MVASTLTPITIDLSGLNFVRDTVLSISTVTPGYAGTITLFGGFLTFASDLVAYDMFGFDIVNGREQAVRG
jgi:hypothetical protein